MKWVFVLGAMIAALIATLIGSLSWETFACMAIVGLLAAIIHFRERLRGLAR